MRPPDAYAAFALVYDRGLGAMFFDGVRPVLDRLDREYPSTRRTHLDLACGTGLVVRHFLTRGYDSIGLDASLAMLERARARGDSVLASDFRSFSFRATFDRVTCLYDSLNHVMDEDDLAAVFASVRDVMDADSLFWFDLNHPDSYRTTWAIPEPYRAGAAGWDLAIDTRYDPHRNLAVARVTGSCEVDGEVFPIDETHYQRSWSEDDVRRILEASGLASVDVFRFNPFGVAHDPDALVKLMYVAAAK
jgi:SAM-dependent methyltransferase